MRKQSVKDFAYPSSLFEALKDLLKGVYDYKGLGTNFSQHTFSHTLFILEKMTGVNDLSKHYNVTVLAALFVFPLIFVC